MNLLEKISRLSSLITGYTDQSIIRELDMLADKLKEQRFYIVVLGLFKRGKSTLINALLEKEIAPVSVTPLTAIVSVIDYNKEPMVNVYFTNGEILQTTIENIEEYVTEERNPENIKQVNYVNILDDASFLQHVSLVDTPGLGSTYEHNTATTLAFVPRVDAALFILSADIPISKTDIEFLKTLHATVPRIIYVFNKTDLLNESDLQKITEHNKKVLAKELKLDEVSIELLVVSGKDKNVLPLKNKLLSFSTEEKTSMLQAAALHQFDLLRSKALLEIRLKRDAFLMPLHELEMKQSELNASMQLMNEQKEEFESTINGKINLLQQMIHESVSDTAQKIRESVYAKVDTLVARDAVKEENMQSLQVINDFILEAFGIVKNEWEQKAKEHFKNLLSQYSARSQSFLNELAKNLTALLNFDFDLLANKFDLNIYSSFYLTLDSGRIPVYYKNVFVKTIMPRSAKKNLQMKWREHYNEIIIHNASSIIYDLQYKIQESFRQFNYDLNNHLYELLDSIRHVLQKTHAERNDAQQTVADRIDQLNVRIDALQVK